MYFRTIYIVFQLKNCQFYIVFHKSKKIQKIIYGIILSLTWPHFGAFFKQRTRKLSDDGTLILPRHYFLQLSENWDLRPRFRGWKRGCQKVRPKFSTQVAITKRIQRFLPLIRLLQIARKLSRNWGTCIKSKF